MANEMTREGYTRLLEELEQLRTAGRDEIAARIKEARSFGDLSENAEYDEAMNAQAIMEARIAKLEDELGGARIIDEDEISTEEIKTGVKVKLHDVEMDEDVVYQILGKSQADPEKGIISDQSPVGKALIGRKIGETVTAELPNGAAIQFEILSIMK
ncbi:MAG: transcription elongation factor GreA [Oscillospiraceae bacterium]|nr:transcription elongation factor GreA [Oscillospiraceae bacterium]